MGRHLLLCALLCAAVGLAGCAGTDCNFHSQCDRRQYCLEGTCRQDCTQDFDCAAGLVCTTIGQCRPPMDGGLDAGPLDASDTGAPPQDTGPPPRDTWTPPPPDTGRPPPRDTGPPPPRDTGPPPIDTGPLAGTGRYLDRCASASDCMSLLCVDDAGGTRMCSRSCATSSACANGHVCAGGQCVADDTGQPCAVSSPATCAMGLCLGPSGGTGACTKTCASAIDCPSGYACTQAGGMQVCVDIEKPCTVATDCLTGLCLSVQGCTGSCRTAADCPARLSGLVPYTCAPAFGSTGPICVPPTDIIGNQATGDLCRADMVTGRYFCRSGLCDDSAPLGPMCTQVCTERGGCGPGLGCFPQIDPVFGLVLACARAGTRALGAACGSGRECDSGLCDATLGFCTRLCADGLCPAGMTCQPVAGFGIAMCRR